ncbi:MAG TPA: hypothetical protein VD902_01720, partial [Symbiobacteriaceae bacterium]|nr:hypothetical protein [Symbiobacteriaceae bacterium]
MEAWKESAPYQELLHACRAKDHDRQHAIVEQRLAETAGSERAFWLRIRARQRARGAVLPSLSELAWLDLQEALRLAPENQETWAKSLSLALDLCTTTENLQRLEPTLERAKWAFATMRTQHAFWHAIGFLNVKHRKWPNARRCFSRAIRAVEALPPAGQQELACRLAAMLSWRAIAYVAGGGH